MLPTYHFILSIMIYIEIKAYFRREKKKNNNNNNNDNNN